LPSAGTQAVAQIAVTAAVGPREGRRYHGVRESVEIDRTLDLWTSPFGNLKDAAFDIDRLLWKMSEHDL
jgi:hypothetical protein